MLLLASLALAAPCDSPSTIDQLLEGLVSVETELRESRMDGALQASESLERTVLCLEDTLPKMIRPRVYRAIGAPRAPGVREVWWAEARELDADFRYGAEVPPAIATAWETSIPPEPTRPVVPPSVPVPPSGGVDVLIYPQPREKRPLMIGGFAGIVGGGVLFGLAARERGRARDAGPDEADLRRARARGLTAGSLVLGGLGLGAATWGVLIDGGPGLEWTVRL